MLKLLCAVRMRLLLDAIMGGGHRRRSRGLAVVYALLLVYLVVALGGMFGLGFSVLVPLGDMGLSWLYFALAGMAAVALSVGGTVLMAQSQLYDARDNELLLSLPLSPGAILASRMLVLYAMNLLITLLVLVPAGVVYWQGREGWIAGGLAILPGAVAAALLALALGCLFGWLIGLVTARMRRRGLMTVLLSLVLLAVYFYGYFRINVLLQNILLSGQALAEKVRSYLWLFYALGEGLSALSVPGGEVPVGDPQSAGTLPRCAAGQAGGTCGIVCPCCGVLRHCAVVGGRRGSGDGHSGFGSAAAVSGVYRGLGPCDEPSAAAAGLGQ